MSQALQQVTSFDLDSVLYELQRLKFPAHKWRLLANSLRVASVVDNIDADHKDVAGKLQTVISHWIDNTTQHNQWITLVEAISMCDECGVAKQLATAVHVAYTPLPPPIPLGGKRSSENTSCTDFISKRPAIYIHNEGDQDPLSDYVDRLKRVYQAPPPTWNPLPQCEYIKLAMISEKGKRRGGADETIVRHQVKGEVEAIVASRVLVEVDRIFDKDFFDDKRQMILVEGPTGGGKTSLTYHYGKEWAAGNLSMFDVVAVVRLCNLDATKACTLPDLLVCASGNDDGISREMIRYVIKCSRLLLVLDGWDEAPNQLRNLSFFDLILPSFSSQSRILVTSRPEFSEDLHGLANRVEIVGFTGESIYEYFQKALSTELANHNEVEDGCRKLREHFCNHPVIQSCCSIPLNAAILAHLFLTEQSLPSTRHDLFLMLVLNRINRELQERYSQRDLYILSFENLPRKHKIVLNHICVLAFEGVKQNKVVFPQEELERLKLPHDLPTLGLLQIVKGFDKVGKTADRYFDHLSIQELLAAYHISQLEEDEQVKVFQDLLNEHQFSAVLQFYVAFTKFTNQGVRNILTRRDLRLGRDQHTLLTIMRCCFEAQIQTKLFYQEIVPRLSCILWIGDVALTPFDCMSVGYFLAFALRAGELSVMLNCCSIDDHSLALLLGELSKYGKACPAGILHGVTKLYISGNDIGDNGIAHAAVALQTNTTIEILDISNNFGISVIGAKSLGRALSVNSSLEKLDISDTSIGDEGVVHIANALQTNTRCTMKVLNVANCGISDKGVESLAQALAANSSLEKLDIRFNKIGDDGIAHIVTALQKKNNLNSLKLYDYTPTVTDKAALSLAAAFTQKNMVMENMMLGWSSTHPRKTLKKMAKCFRNSTLTDLELVICMPRPSCEAPVSADKEVRKWLQHVKVGGVKFKLSLESSHLRFQLRTPSGFPSFNNFSYSNFDQYFIE